MPSGGAAGRGIFGLIALGVGATILSNSIFNVDGGHRAIKYTRIGGVKKEIYAEGLPSASLLKSGPDSSRNTSTNTLVRDSYRLRCPSQTTQRRLIDRHQRSADGQHHLPCPFPSERRGFAADL